MKGPENRQSGRILFTPGPVTLDDRITSSLFATQYSHREPAFLDLYERVRKDLQRVGGLSERTHECAMLHGSGTLAVDAALSSLVRGKVCVLVNGAYGARIAETLRAGGGATVHEVVCALDDEAVGNRLEGELLEHRPDWLALVHHETTTGRLNPLDYIAPIAESLGIKVFVDAVSSYGIHRLPATSAVVCFNSSKCLESIPGIGGVLWRKDLSIATTIPVLNIQPYSSGMPSTPNIQAIVAMRTALNIYFAENRPARYAVNAAYVWKVGGAQFRPVVVESERSNVLTSFWLDGVDGDALYARALAHDFVLYRGHGQYESKMFRVANMGPLITRETIDELFEVIG